MIADDIKALRASKGLTLRAFARKTGVSHQTLHYIESGRGALATAEAIALAHRHKLALVYNDGREIRLPGTLGRQLAAVRRLLKKKRDDYRRDQARRHRCHRDRCAARHARTRRIVRALAERRRRHARFAATPPH